MRDKGWRRSSNKAARGLCLPDRWKGKGGQRLGKRIRRTKAEVSSFKSEACDAFLSDDMMEVSGQNLWYTQSLWLGDNSKCLISRIQGTPCRGHSLAAEGNGKKQEGHLLSSRSKARIPESTRRLLREGEVDVWCTWGFVWMNPVVIRSWSKSLRVESWWGQATRSSHITDLRAGHWKCFTWSSRRNFKNLKTPVSLSHLALRRLKAEKQASRGEQFLMEVRTA